MIMDNNSSLVFIGNSGRWTIRDSKLKQTGLHCLGVRNPICGRLVDFHPINHLGLKRLTLLDMWSDPKSHLQARSYSPTMCLRWACLERLRPHFHENWRI
ncbi:hypothetical protein M758_6G045200 [Ceratodon purpureus]|nr:hypothetical protein M758_6G045200 [Ceratodon purpureus]